MESRILHTFSRRLLALSFGLLLVSCGGPPPEPEQGAAVAKGGEAGLASDSDSPTDDASGLATASARTTPQLPLRALLVGVADYPAESGVPPLRGPVRDVEAIRKLLLYRFQVEPERIRVLQNEEATVEGIVRAFDEHLLEEVEGGEEVLFYFSGHGSRVHDVSGRESDGLDSSLVAYDSRTGGRDGDYDVTDDMLYSLFRPLVEKGAHVVVMTDSCHSGGVTRGQVRVRGADGGRAGVGGVVDWPFWPETVPFFDDDQRDGSAGLGRGGLDSAGLERFVHLGACTPDQEAVECDVETGVQGVFTWAILDVMRQLHADLTWSDVATRAAARVRLLDSLHTQTLWIDGGGSRREVFGNRFVPALDRFVVSDVGPDRTLSLAGGALHGLEVGVQLMATDESGVWSAGLVVVEVGLTQARAVWEREDVAPPAGLALHAVRAHVGAARQALRVRVVDAKLRSALEGSTWAVVDDGPHSPYVVEAGQDGRVSFRTSEGIPIWSQVESETGDLAQLVSALQNAFLREARFQALWQLGDPTRAEEPVSVSVELAAGSELKDGEVPIALQKTRGAAAGSYDLDLPTDVDIAREAVPKPTGLVRVRLAELKESPAPRSRPTGDLFLHVLSLNEARDVEPIYQAPDHPITRAQIERTVSRDLLLNFYARPADVFPLERPMRERILVIVSQVPLDIDSLKNRVESTTRGVPRGLPQVLEGAFGGRTLRSGGSPRSSAAGVGLGWLDLSVSRREG